MFLSRLLKSSPTSSPLALYSLGFSCWITGAKAFSPLSDEVWANDRIGA
jgi:hypothetical protein